MAFLVDYGKRRSTFLGFASTVASSSLLGPSALSRERDRHMKSDKIEAAKARTIHEQNRPKLIIKTTEINNKRSPMHDIRAAKTRFLSRDRSSYLISGFQHSTLTTKPSKTKMNISEVKLSLARPGRKMNELYPSWLSGNPDFEEITKSMNEKRKIKIDRIAAKLPRHRGEHEKEILLN